MFFRSIDMPETLSDWQRSSVLVRQLLLQRQRAEPDLLGRVLELAAPSRAAAAHGTTLKKFCCALAQSVEWPSKVPVWDWHGLKTLRRDIRW